MKSVILAAGRGSRLGKLTDDKPKTLIEFKGKKLLSNTISILDYFFKPSDIFVVTGYKSNQIQKNWQNCIFNPFWNEMNIGSSILSVKHFLEFEPVLFIYSDIYFEKQALIEIVNSKNTSLVSVANWRRIWEKRFSQPEKDLESFKLNKDGYLIEIGRKNPEIDKIDGQFSGIFSIFPDDWKLLSGLGENFIAKSDTTSLINKLISLGTNPKTFQYSGIWAEIDSASDIELQS